MRIATHSGPFHADDVFAVAILKRIHPEAEIVRTRDEERLARAQIRVDVGRKYDPASGDFDHHQPEGAGARSNEIPYAAAGLVWKHYGSQLTSGREAWERIDSKLLMPIDANDNGVALFENPKLYPYTINDVVRIFNPGWQDSESDYDAAFLRAVDFADFVLGEEIERANGIVEARAVVLGAIERSDGEIIVLEKFVPWKRIAIEESQAKYAVYESADGTWRCHAVPAAEERFDLRKPLPAEWAGLEGEKLGNLTGVPDAIFCHRNLFLCGAKTREGALALARKALAR